MILSMDTSGKVSSFSVIEGDNILVEGNINTRLTHSQTLMPMCEDLLKASKISIEDIDVFAVTKGPGSFTGLRIGIAAVKGFAYALNKPCVAVSSLEALAYNLLGFDGVVCSIVEARNEEAYMALFQVSSKLCKKTRDIDYKVERLTADLSININDAAKMLKNYKQTIFFVGDGANMWYNYFSARFVDKEKDVLCNIRLAPPALRLQKATSVGLVAARMYENNEFIDASGLVPSYKKDPQAVREYMLKHGS